MHATAGAFAIHGENQPSVLGRLADRGLQDELKGSAYVVIEGVDGRAVHLASGRFAMIDNGLGFELVPWKPALEEHVSRHISGVVKPGGTVDWSFNRTRGLGVS